MRIAFVLTQSEGGPVDVTLAVMLELASRGFEVALFAPRPARGGAAIEPYLHEIDVSSKLSVRAMRRTRRRILGFAPDIVHAQDRRSGLMCARLGGPRAPLVVHTYHGVPDDVSMPWLTLGTPPRPSFYTHATLAADAVVARAVDHTVVVADMMGTFLKQRLRVPAHKVSHIDNGLPLPPHTPPTGTNRLLFVGLLVRRKGVHMLLDALAAALRDSPGLLLDVAGDGPERAALQEQAQRLGLGEAVRFLGFRSDIPQLLATHDALVLPSSMEQQPLVLIEAMAAGKLIVATATGGIVDMLRDLQDGIQVVAPGNTKELTGALLALGTTKNVQAASKEISAAARQRFSVSTCTDRHLELYSRLSRG
ncbi:MAG: glycosyl transferase [Micrococcales bacterium]|nr:MAG: glycosyl transferase [Micrococcales bacterium]